MSCLLKGTQTRKAKGMVLTSSNLIKPYKTLRMTWSCWNWKVILTREISQANLHKSRNFLRKSKWGLWLKEIQSKQLKSGIKKPIISSLITSSIRMRTPSLQTRNSTKYKNSNKGRKRLKGKSFRRNRSIPIAKRKMYD